MKTITLQTKKQLNIYVNPQRQTILRELRIAGIPMTPKQLSDRIGISASSIQHHIQKLLNIGVIELSHTELIHGITAKYYQLTRATVSFGIAIPDGSMEQRLALMQDALTKTFAGYAHYCQSELPNTQPDQPFGDILMGIVHLQPSEAKQLYQLIQNFIQSHESKTTDTAPWEYALIQYPVSRKNHD